MRKSNKGWKIKNWNRQKIMNPEKQRTLCLAWRRPAVEIELANRRFCNNRCVILKRVNTILQGVWGNLNQ